MKVMYLPYCGQSVCRLKKHHDLNKEKKMKCYSLINKAILQEVAT